MMLRNQLVSTVNFPQKLIRTVSKLKFPLFPFPAVNQVPPHAETPPSYPISPAPRGSEQECQEPACIFHLLSAAAAACASGN
jgi:hypothetical protein